MAQETHTSNAAVVAVRGIAGIAEDVAVDVVDAIRPYIEAPFIARIKQLEAMVAELESAASAS